MNIPDIMVFMAVITLLWLQVRISFALKDLMHLLAENQRELDAIKEDSFLLL